MQVWDREFECLFKSHRCLRGIHVQFSRVKNPCGPLGHGGSTEWATGPLRLLRISRRNNQACRKACLVPPGRMNGWGDRDKRQRIKGSARSRATSGDCLLRCEDHWSSTAKIKDGLPTRPSQLRSTCEPAPCKGEVSQIKAHDGWARTS